MLFRTLELLFRVRFLWGVRFAPSSQPGSCGADEVVLVQAKGVAHCTLRDLTSIESEFP